jgi:hypothetical protein
MKTKLTAQELREALPNISEDCLELNVGPTKQSQNTAVQQVSGSTVGPTRKSKYNSIPTLYNGVRYHSKKEAAKAAELDLRVKAGEIDYVLRQVPFDLGASIIYKADFMTFTKFTLQYPSKFGWKDLWKITVYEVKGMETPAWKLKHKLFKEKYPLIRLELI